MWEKNMYDSNEPLEHGSECFLKIFKFYLIAYLFDSDLFRIYSIHMHSWFFPSSTYYEIENLWLFINISFGIVIRTSPFS